MAASLPVHFDLLLAAVAVVVFHEAVLDAVFVDAFGDFDVVAAVFGDEFHLALLPPADGVETVGSFSLTKAGGGDGFELQAVPEGFFEVDEQIEAVELVAEVEEALAEEHLVIEADVVEADDEIGAAELLDELRGLILGVDAGFAEAGAVGAGDGDAHLVLVSPAADVARGEAGLEVKINDVRHARAS